MAAVCPPRPRTGFSPHRAAWFGPASTTYIRYSYAEQGACFTFLPRQAMIVNVCDDMVVFERHEVNQGGKLGPDWVMPLGEYKPHPFTREELKNVIGEPQFGKKAKLVVEKGRDGVPPPSARAPDVASASCRDGLSRHHGIAQIWWMKKVVSPVVQCPCKYDIMFAKQ